jgi:ElaA protein
MMATAKLERFWASDLDIEGLYKALRLRAEVFVLEQRAHYQDLDGIDLLPETRHLWLTENGETIAYLRLSEEYDDGTKSFRISRACTAEPQRGRGHTTRLLQAALAEVGSAACRIDAQSYLVDMYAKHGFAPEGAEFDDGGITHVPMCRHGGKPWRGEG